MCVYVGVVCVCTCTNNALVQLTKKEQFACNLICALVKLHRHNTSREVLSSSFKLLIIQILHRNCLQLRNYSARPFLVVSCKCNIHENTVSFLFQRS